jgi:DUF2997 family protein
VKRVTLRIRRDGTVEAETHGMKGRECLPYITRLEELLEAEAVDSDYTEDYYYDPVGTEDQTAVQEEQVDRP